MSKILPHTDIIKSNLYQLKRLTLAKNEVFNSRVIKRIVEYIFIQLEQIEVIVREKNKEIFKLNEEIAELIREKQLV